MASLVKNSLRTPRVKNAPSLQIVDSHEFPTGPWSIWVLGGSSSGVLEAYLMGYPPLSMSNLDPIFSALLLFFWTIESGNLTLSWSDLKSPYHVFIWSSTFSN